MEKKMVWAERIELTVQMARLVRLGKIEPSALTELLWIMSHQEEMAPVVENLRKLLMENDIQNLTEEIKIAV